MGAATFQRGLWNQKQSDVMRHLLRLRTFELRQLKPIHRVTKPSVPHRAHALGYKAKQGYVIISVAIRRGTKKVNAKHGIKYGKPSNNGIRQKRKSLSLQAMAEQKVGREYQSLRMLGSYWVAQDANSKYYEVIMVDPMHAAIRNDSKINWICDGTSKRREARGKTHATKSSRAIGRGIGYKQTAGGSYAAHQRKVKKIALRKYR
ncbi:MAG: 60S ribosomal protein L15 [Marteilia pararefringens]